MSTIGKRTRASTTAERAIDNGHQILSPDECVDKHKSKIQKMQEIVGFLASARSAVDSMCEAYECSITGELPFDPVTAQDGHVYERGAIEQWFSKSPGPEAKSPLNGEMIGKNLMPCVQLRNLLSKMVESGAIHGPKADAWQLAMSNAQEVAELVKQAEAGSAQAMRRLGFSHRDGTRGVQVDVFKAFKYFKAAAEKHDPPATASYGIAYLYGSGVAKNVARGISFMTVAATLGSEHACGALGWANQCGHYGFDVNFDEAKKWYKEMDKINWKDTSPMCRDRAAKFLAENP